MKRNTFGFSSLAAAAWVALTCVAAAVAGAASTNFTFQGQLKAGGVPSSGAYDFQFKLWDADLNGAQQGPTVSFDDLNVVDGLFTVELNFGNNVFAGDDRYLEVLVRDGASNGAYTTLTRQHITATPYALYALNGKGNTLDQAYDQGGPGAGRTITADSGAVQVVGGTDSEPGSGGFLVLGSTTSTNLSLDNNELMARNNGGVATLSLNYDGGDIILGGGAQNSRVLVNRTSPVSSAEYFGVYAPTTAGNYGGMYLQTGTDGLPFYGYDAGSQTCWTYMDGSTGDWHVHNGGDYLTVTDGGRVGIKDTTPSNTLTVNGTADMLGLGVGTASPEEMVHFYNGSGTALKVEGYGGADAAMFYGGQGTAVYATSNSRGVSGKVTKNWDGYAIYGEANDGNEGGAGVHGFSFKGKGVYGYDYATTGGGVGVYGRSDSSGGYGVYCKGDFGASGSKAFAIDHPLDPENKILKHYCPEGPEPMLVYSGNVVLNEQGEATIELPSYFEAINKDLRYQLTCIGGFAQVYVAQEVRDNQFKIAGGKAGMKVSWQVSGVRNDAYIQTYGAPVEIEKADDRKGLYISPELYGAENQPTYYGLTKKADGSNGQKSE